MIPRKRLDIDWADLLFGVRQCLRPPTAVAAGQALRQWLPPGESFLPTLSVRSGLDALLQSLAFDPGDEILVSAITIRDIPRIIRDHGLIPIPVDLDASNLSVCPAALARAINSRSKAILVAHLFGSRMPMEPIMQFARAHNLMVFEDCAQTFAADGYWGDPACDVSLFSFGPIKTATALAGGILRFRDAERYHEVRRIQNRWPIQSNRGYLGRIAKYLMLKIISSRLPYGTLTGLCRALGKDHDLLIASSVRGFAGPNFTERIQHRPCGALIAMMGHRLGNYRRSKIDERIETAKKLIERMPGQDRPGAFAGHHTHWVFPILVDNPESQKLRLWGQGIDATQGGSNLIAIEPPPDRPETAPHVSRQIIKNILYLPVNGGMPLGDLERIARGVNELEMARDASDLM